MNTVKEALAYMKANTVTDNNGRSYKTGEEADKAVAILNEMVQEQKQYLRIIRREVAATTRLIMGSIFMIIAMIGAAYWVSVIMPNIEKWILGLSVLVAVVLAVATYKLYTGSYRTLRQQCKSLEESISQNSYIKVNR